MPKRVAMFVLNPCHNDARVRKEATSLGRAGYDVRVFALGNSSWPEELLDEGAFTIQRLEVRSLYQDVVATIGDLMRRARAFRRRRFSGGPDRLAVASGADPDTTPAAGDGAGRVADGAAGDLAVRMRNVVRRRLVILHGPSVRLEFWRRARDAAAAWEPDAVHGHDLNAMPPAAALAKRLQVPLVYDSHELWRHRNKVHGRRPLGTVGDALQERRLIRRADAVITVADSIGAWLQRTYRLPAGRVRILRNVPLRRDGVPPGEVSLRRDHGLVDRRIILYGGRLTTGRGIEEAVDALSALPEDVVLVLLGYGDHDYVAEVLRRAVTAGVRDRVVLVPPVPSEQVAAVAAEADVALVAITPICLSYTYALPNKLFEAIQGHVPVVATDLPEIARIVRAHGIGELYTPGDPAGLARGVQVVLGDRERYRAGTYEAAEELNWERESTVLLDTYRELLPQEDRG